MQEFASNAAAALHLTELNQYIPHLDLWLMGLLAVLGLLCCFFGYKLHKLWFAGGCLVFGCLAGCYLFSQGILDINFSIAAGLLAGCLFVFTYKLAAPEIGFSILLFLLIRMAGMGLTAALVPSAVLAVIAFFLPRWVLTLTTAVFGAYSLVTLLPRFPLEDRLPVLSLLNPAHREYFLVLGGLALLGFLVQFGFGSADPLIHFRRK